LSFGIKYTHVIWDWNGTLLDDVEWSVSVINRMLTLRNLKPFSGLDEYRNVFHFPVIEYYREVGFDFKTSPFDELAAQYIELYYAYPPDSCHLRQGAERVLGLIKESHIPQVVLSASKSEHLKSQIDDFGVSHYFDEILGNSDIYAASKVDFGTGYIKRIGPDAAPILIGDTAHDFEVARAMGIDCILITGGHQSEEVLGKCAVPIVHDIADIIDYVCRRQAQR